MIITKTPLRISFFGGGTDYPAWFMEQGGLVLSTTIDKYSYITCRYLPPFFLHDHRITYSRIEHVTGVENIQHPSVRECLKFLNITKGIEIHHDADLPARSGLGSSSAFTVGLLQSLYALRGRSIDRMALAQAAIEVETKWIREDVGWQDQTAAAFGGFNVIEFGSDHCIDVRPLAVSPDRLEALNHHLVLIYTGLSRYAPAIAKTIVENTKRNGASLHRMKEMVYEAVSILTSNSDLHDFGTLLHESWNFKKTLSDHVSTPDIDDIYQTMLSAGALGGKLLGAGGGGFFLAFVPTERQPTFRKKLDKLLTVPFRFENGGCQIIYHQPQEELG